eukprot:351645-Chlamydomonas_euryale.AAC.6
MMRHAGAAAESAPTAREKRSPVTPWCGRLRRLRPEPRARRAHVVALGRSPTPSVSRSSRTHHRSHGGDAAPPRAGDATGAAATATGAAAAAAARRDAVPRSALGASDHVARSGSWGGLVPRMQTARVARHEGQQEHRRHGYWTSNTRLCATVACGHPPWLPLMLLMLTMRRAQPGGGGAADRLEGGDEAGRWEGPSPRMHVQSSGA